MSLIRVLVAVPFLLGLSSIFLTAEAKGQAPKAAPKAKEPALPKDADPIYKSIRLMPGEIDGDGPYVVGQTIKFKFHLQNTTSTDVALPQIKLSSGDVPSPGIEQGWIERLGKDPQILARAKTDSRQGAKYADGGTFIFGPEKIKGTENFNLKKRELDTKDYPPGKYRYTLELRDAKNRVIQSETIDFELKAK